MVFRRAVFPETARIEPLFRSLTHRLHMVFEALIPWVPGAENLPFSGPRAGFWRVAFLGGETGCPGRAFNGF